MYVGERWRNRKTGEVVRIEVFFAGMLSFSVLREGEWFMCRSLWDEVQFTAEFSKAGPEACDA